MLACCGFPKPKLSHCAFAGVTCLNIETATCMGIARCLWLMSCGLQYLGMVKPSSVKRGFLRRLLRDVEEHGEQKLEHARYDLLLGDPDYHQLKQLTTLDVHQMLKRYVSKLHLRGGHYDDHVGAPSMPIP